MEKIDRELLIKEISSRLPYGVKVQVLGWDEEKGEVEVPLRVYSVNTDGYIYFESNDYDVDYVAVDNCLLFLRPMSNMTEEEYNKYELTFDNVVVYSGHNNNNIHSEHRPTYETFDYLDSIHVDYRDLIPKGLALVAPEGMYNIK